MLKKKKKNWNLTILFFYDLESFYNEQYLYLTAFLKIIQKQYANARSP